MTYELNQTFKNEYPPEAALFCNENGLVIFEIEQTADGARQFQIREPPAPTEAETRQVRINELKARLSETDYKAIKYAEGLISADEYAETKAQRQEWRSEINELEAGSEDENTSAILGN